MRTADLHELLVVLRRHLPIGDPDVLFIRDVVADGLLRHLSALRSGHSDAHSTDKIKEYELSIDKQKQLLKDKQTQTEVLQEKVALYSQRLLQETGDWDKKQANVLRLAELKENYTKFLQSAH